MTARAVMILTFPICPWISSSLSSLSSRAYNAILFPEKTLQPFSLALICLYIRKILLNGLKGKPFSNLSVTLQQSFTTFQAENLHEVLDSFS